MKIRATFQVERTLLLRGTLTDETMELDSATMDGLEVTLTPEEYRACIEALWAAYDPDGDERHDH